MGAPLEASARVPGRLDRFASFLGTPPGPIFRRVTRIYPDGAEILTQDCERAVKDGPLAIPDASLGTKGIRDLELDTRNRGKSLRRSARPGRRARAAVLLRRGRFLQERAEP